MTLEVPNFPPEPEEEEKQFHDEVRAQLDDIEKEIELLRHNLKGVTTGGFYWSWTGFVWTLAIVFLGVWGIAETIAG